MLNNDYRIIIMTGWWLVQFPNWKKILRQPTNHLWKFIWFDSVNTLLIHCSPHWWLVQPTNHLLIQPWGNRKCLNQQRLISEVDGWSIVVMATMAVNHDSWSPMVVNDGLHDGSCWLVVTSGDEGSMMAILMINGLFNGGERWSMLVNGAHSAMWTMINGQNWLVHSDNEI